MKRLFLLCSLLLIIAGCKEVFEDPPKSYLQLSLLSSTSGNSISPTVNAWGPGRDSLWISDKQTSEILLPFTPNDSTQFILSLDSKNDTLTFFHKTTLSYASMETGFYYEYYLDSVHFTRSRIDSIQITDSLVTTKWHENIKLYIRPLPAGNN